MIWPGHVTTTGHVKLDDRHGFAADCKRHAGQRIDLSIGKHKTQRSLAQNDFLHARVFPVLAEHFGYTIPEVKLVLMGECWGWKELDGHSIPAKPSTSEMTVEEATYFIDWVVPWASIEHGVVLMLPNEMEMAGAR